MIMNRNVVYFGFLSLGAVLAGCSSSSDALPDARVMADAALAHSDGPVGTNPDAPLSHPDAAPHADAPLQQPDAAPHADAPPSIDAAVDATVDTGTCGNGIIEPGEQCDDGVDNANALCPDTNCIADTCQFGPAHTGINAISFAAPVQYSIGTIGEQVVVGFFNGDDSLDIEATVGTQAGGVTALINDGTGTFTTKAANASPQFAYGAGAGDFNGDQIEDLAVVGFFSNQVFLMIGVGDGTFIASPAGFAVGSESIGVLVTDLNDDGNLDVIAMNYGSSNISVLLGDGNGGFASAVDYATGQFPGLDASAGDLDGDGNLDIVVPNGDGTISILLGSANGDGTLQPQTQLTGLSSTSGVSLDDLDGDGNLDLVASDDNGAIRLYYGNGDGSFADPIVMPPASGNNSFHVLTDDFDNDGFDDIVTTTQNQPASASVVLNTTGQ